MFPAEEAGDCAVDFPGGGGSGNDKGNGGDDNGDAEEQSDGQRLMEYDGAEEDGGNRFECAEDSGWGCADIVDGFCGADKRYNGGEDGEGEGVGACGEGVKHLEIAAEPEADKEYGQPEQYDVQSKFFGGKLLKARLVYADDIYRVGESGQ